MPADPGKWRAATWRVLFAGCAITLTVRAFNLSRDGSRVLDPRLRGAV